MEVLIFLPTLGKKKVFPHSNFASPPSPFLIPSFFPFPFPFPSNSFTPHFPFLFTYFHFHIFMYIPFLFHFQKLGDFVSFSLIFIFSFTCFVQISHFTFNIFRWFYQQPQCLSLFFCPYLFSFEQSLR